MAVRVYMPDRIYHFTSAPKLVVQYVHTHLPENRQLHQVESKCATCTVLNTIIVHRLLLGSAMT